MLVYQRVTHVKRIVFSGARPRRVDHATSCIDSQLRARNMVACPPGWSIQVFNTQPQRPQRPQRPQLQVFSMKRFSGLVDVSSIL